MFDVLFHSSCQYCKKRGQGRYWDSDKLYDVATEMTMGILQRYFKNPDYKINSHITQVHYAFLHVVYSQLKKQDIQDSKTCSFEGSNIDKIAL